MTKRLLMVAGLRPSASQDSFARVAAAGDTVYVSAGQDQVLRQRYQGIIRLLNQADMFV